MPSCPTLVVARTSGQNGELNGYIKIGRDEHNFYMYRTPVNEGPAQSAWDPEIRVDLTRFQTLRAQLENNFLTSSADSLACTGTDLELVRRSGLPRGTVVRGGDHTLVSFPEHVPDIVEWAKS